jgi:DNA-binding transcriptional regulator YdaS (Cro superfamily)
MQIEQAIEETGLNIVARRMGISAQRVSNWRTRGIPDGSVLEFCRAVGWKVTPHQLRPNIYPNPTDGLPVDLNLEAA